VWGAALLFVVMTMLLVASGVTTAAAQSGDIEMSCAPESVSAGATTVCDVGGVAASTRVTIEVRSAGTVVGQSSAIAGTDGRAAIEVAIPADTAPGRVTLALRGTTLTFDVTVTPGRPTGVSAGLSPSSGDIERGVPFAPIAGLMLALPLLLTLSRRAHQD
jgi:hypothetical protein